MIVPCDAPFVFLFFVQKQRRNLPDMNRKKIILLPLLVFSFLLPSYGQTRTDKIKSIRQWVQYINRDSHYKTLTLTNEEFIEETTDGGSELTGYFKGDTICKINEWIGLSYGIIQTEYYFKNRKLIFVYETEKHFPVIDSTQQIDNTKSELAFEGRYYFDNEKTIQVLTKGKRRWESKHDIPSDLLADSKRYSTLLKSKRQ
jgi:hypothetical protein